MVADEIPSSFNHAVVDGVPVIWTNPSQRSNNKVALWLPPFTQTKEAVIPMLQELANKGFVAVSLDPFQHGERGIESNEDLTARVFEPGNFRRSMWPILGQTVLDAKRVIDWVFEKIAVDSNSVAAGGLSMGGDITVALAGIDQRVARVAAIVSTPDWTRPGMRSFDEPYGVVEQGDADQYAEWFYAQFNPLTHLERYTEGCAITFECAENDKHVPPNGALKFRDELQQLSPQTQALVRVNLHAGYEHGDGSEPVFAQYCLDWLSQ